MNFRKILLIGSAFLCLGITGCGDEEEASSSKPPVAEVDIQAIGSTQKDFETPVSENAQAEVLKLLGHDEFQGSNIAGPYLSSIFAQNRTDWKNAAQYLEESIRLGSVTDGAVKRLVILSAGAGDVEKAISWAKTLDVKNDDGTLIPLFKILEAVRAQNYADALKEVNAVSQTGFIQFIHPMMKSWVVAGQERLDVEALSSNTIYLYQAALIAEYLNKKEQVLQILYKMMQAQDLTLDEILNIADMYQYLGEREKAQELYKQLMELAPTSSLVQERMVNSDGHHFKPVQSIEDGASRALYEMARLLYQKQGDDSARIFAHLALYLNPEHKRAQIMIAGFAEDDGRYEDALRIYKTVSAEYEEYETVQRHIPELYLKMGQKGEAIEALRNVYVSSQDIKALIRIGDLQREDKEFQKAIRTYTDAQRAMESDESLYSEENMWHIHYVRGMSYEQEGKLEEAYKDLQAALEVKPDHPYVLNYLAYSWVDHGQNLDKSLEMLQKAVALRPDDGYIVDSLGWAYYKLNNYPKAVEYLDQAVALMPSDPTINDHLGDAFWQTGRRREARFQWERARNAAGNDQEMLDALEEKLRKGL